MDVVLLATLCLCAYQELSAVHDVEVLGELEACNEALGVGAVVLARSQQIGGSVGAFDQAEVRDLAPELRHAVQ